MKKILIISTITSSILLASGYRLPEGSINSTALSGAYVAGAHGADSSYYNPANMVFNDNINEIEGDLTYINLSKIKYNDNIDPNRNSSSKEENIIAPSLFYTSSPYNCMRFGLALTVPGGLSKRWESPYAKASAEEFTLEIVEFNPTVAYKLNDQLAIAGGVRAVYSSGIVKSDATSLGKPVIRDMEADTTEFGYNLALAYKPTSNINLSTTYRSNIDLNHEGNAKLYLSGTKLYDGGASIEVPLPAIAAVAVAYDFSNTKVEVEWDRTFWSEYKTLDFEFKDNVPAALKESFDDPKARDWSDTDTFRIGISHNLNNKLTLMGGFAIDENPAPTQHVGFELPDSDSKLYSAGLRYSYSDKISFGASVLYDDKDERSVSQGRSVDEPLAVEGTFTDASALLVTTGVTYKY